MFVIIFFVTKALKDKVITTASARNTMFDPVAAKLANFLEKYQAERLVSGASSLAVFALIISLVIYAIFSWRDVYDLGISTREQILHIAVPIFVAIALLPVGVHHFLQGLDAIQE